MSVQSLPQWKQLKRHLDADINSISLSELAASQQRFDNLCFSFDQLTIDFSKQKISQQTIELLVELAEAVQLKQKVADLFAGKIVNKTENRAALHTALRSPAKQGLLIDGKDINHDIHAELEKMSSLVSNLAQGHWRGYSGKPITDVVNLGVGGSDLGPLLVCEALNEFQQIEANPVNVHFASTMDGSQVSSLFAKLNPETTLFVIVSKSFTTIDTLSNANSARAWLLSYYNDENVINRHHFIGISANSNKMTEWGIAADKQLKFWQWVGGRFSLWSSVGLSIAIKLGMDNFNALLAGAHAMDEHFLNAEHTENLPVLFGLLGIWNTNFLQINAQAILPYDARLKYFPSYLTQLEMESNGKSVTTEGKKIEIDSCPVLWGEVGPNAQHAFYQLLHQGTRKVVCDFIAPVKRFTNAQTSHEKSLQEQHILTLANCFAQSRALMLGSADKDQMKNNNKDKNNNDSLNRHRHYPGGQPSTTILLQELTPYSLGQLIALYEHKVYVMACLWDINPFDQWGVELGKTMAKQTLDLLYSQDKSLSLDPSSNYLINTVRSSNKINSQQQTKRRQ